MQFFDLAKKRYSCRRYKPDKVSPDDLRLILEAGKVCPTACNYQPFHLLVLQDETALAKARRAGRLYNSPVIIIVCGDTEKAWKRPQDGKKSTDIDAAILTDHMMLEATELGLSTLWICWFDPAVIREEFALPSHLEPINILLVGYGDDEPKSPDRHGEARKPLSDYVSYDGLYSQQT